MQTIRIPDEQWGEIWRLLVASGPVSCIGPEPIYIVSDQQLSMLRRKKLPFEIVDAPNGRKKGPNHA